MTVMRASCRWPRTVVADVPGTFEAHVVARLGVAHVERAVGRVDDHVEEHGADVREGGRLARRVGERVDAEHVAIRQIEAHRVRPVAAELVFPETAGLVVLHDQADFGAGDAFGVRVRRRQPSRDLRTGQTARHLHAVDAQGPAAAPPSHTAPSVTVVVSLPD